MRAESWVLKGGIRWLKQPPLLPQESEHPECYGRRMEKKASPRALAGQLGHPKHTTEEVFGKKSSTDRNGRLPGKRIRLPPG